ncbi:MAG: nicotinate phosphoribosyltransferase [Spirochaetota bacterium]
MQTTLLTDLYQLTMAQGYWLLGRHEQNATFSLFFRKQPFSGGYAVACGLEKALAYLQNFAFSQDEVAYLATLQGYDETPLFHPEFLQYLQQLRLQVEVLAAAEGTVVFAQEPLMRVTGSLLQCQLLESYLLNVINFETLVATKASRIVMAAEGEPVLEFGLRRAQGNDGALAASRASFVGGCAATSNVLAGYQYGIPVRGTHAHSWVMSFTSEQESFQAYADAMPNNCVFLIDTYDTIRGVKHAIAVGKTLQEKGKQLLGVRLDSGDLTYLSQKVRKILDEAGFAQTKIYASNDLDELLIRDIKQQGAKISVWGVGTKLSTAYEQPALGGVYKLTARQDNSGKWLPTLKMSEQKNKVNIPGMLQIRRYELGETFCGDMIYDSLQGEPKQHIIIDPKNSSRRKQIKHTKFYDLLQPVFNDGKRLTTQQDLFSIQEYAKKQLASLHEGITRLRNPHEYPVGLESELYKLREEMILQARGFDA